MKSALRQETEADLISSEAKAEDFIRACEDFIVQSTISLKNIQGYALIYLRKCDIIDSPINKNLKVCASIQTDE